MTSKGRSIWPPMIWIARYIDSSTSCTVPSVSINVIKHKRFGLLTVLIAFENRGISIWARVARRHNEGKEPASRAASWSRASQGGSYIYRPFQQSDRWSPLNLKNQRGSTGRPLQPSTHHPMKIDLKALDTRNNLLSWFDLQHRNINGINLHVRHQLWMATLPLVCKVYK